MNPRTLCARQPVALISSASVAPSSRCNRASTASFFVTFTAAGADGSTGGFAICPNYDFVLAPRPNIFEAQLAFCQLVEFSPNLYIDCLIAAANPNPDSAGVDVGCANGTALGTQDVQCVGFLHHWLLLL
jgi:hypothetical protein